MAYQATFKRYELKYLLNPEQKAALKEAMEDHMKLDEYGRTTIRNIYYDTPSFRLIRHSLDKPVYKEKLRIRCYHPVGPNDEVFVELKKKYRSVVYKRRLTLPEKQTMNAFRNNKPLPVRSQIGDEIDYFRRFYKNLRPAVFLSYEREAYYDLGGSELRITFDENILYRQKDLSLEAGVYGKAILEDNLTLMEVKTAGGLPLWLTHAMTEHNVHRCSFSKYGAAYQDIVKQAAAH